MRMFLDFFFGFFRGFLGSVKFGFINIPSSLCDINLQRLVKIFGYHDEFIILPSYEERDGNPEKYIGELICRDVCHV